MHDTALFRCLLDRSGLVEYRRNEIAIRGDAAAARPAYAAERTYRTSDCRKIT